MVPMLIPTIIISLSVAMLTLGLVVWLMRRQRARMEKIVADFASQNVTMARRLTEIMLSQQKKQETHEEALEKIAGYAMIMRKEINLLASHAMEEEDEITIAVEESGKQRLH
jgi:hypothetical protein